MKQLLHEIVSGSSFGPVKLGITYILQEYAMNKSKYKKVFVIHFKAVKEVVSAKRYLVLLAIPFTLEIQIVTDP